MCVRERERERERCNELVQFAIPFFNAFNVEDNSSDSTLLHLNKRSAFDHKQIYAREFLNLVLHSSLLLVSGSLDIRLVTDNKKCWQTVKPILSDKCQSNNKILIAKMKTLLYANMHHDQGYCVKSAE